jgi:hypothetical protein
MADTQDDNGGGLDETAAAKILCGGRGRDCIGGMEQTRHQFLPDAVLGEYGAAVEQKLGEYASRVEPEDLQSLMDPVARDIFGKVLRETGADSGVIWLADAERTDLVAGYSHKVEKLEGLRQPLDEGLISLVLGSEQAICENQVYEDERHSKRIDEKMGMITCAMIAVPFYLGGNVRGVVSCVQWKESADEPDPPGFTGSDLSQVKLFAAGAERLVNYQLLKIILDLEV